MGAIAAVDVKSFQESDNNSSMAEKITNRWAQSGIVDNQIEEPLLTVTEKAYIQKMLDGDV